MFYQLYYSWSSLGIFEVFQRPNEVILSENLCINYIFMGILFHLSKMSFLCPYILCHINPDLTYVKPWNCMLWNPAANILLVFCSSIFLTIDHFPSCKSISIYFGLWKTYILKASNFFHKYCCEVSVYQMFNVLTCAFSPILLLLWK